MPVSDLALTLSRVEPWTIGVNVVSAAIWTSALASLVARHRREHRVAAWQWWVVIMVNVPIAGVLVPVGAALWLTGRVIDRTDGAGRGGLLDRWVSPVGVSQHTARQLQESLEPGEQLCFVFEVQTKRTAGRRLLHGFNMVTGRGRLDVFGTRMSWSPTDRFS